MNDDFLGLRSESNKINNSQVVTIEGKQYLKTHATLVREGVWNGVYYPFSALAATLNMWPRRPIIMPTHMQEIAVDSWPDELKEGHVYGFIDNPKLDHQDNAIQADLYFELEKLTNSPYKSVLNNLLTNKPINNSVGMFGGAIEKSGNYKGIDYNYTIEKITAADHLAILPYNLGACSLKDGCGVGLSKTKKGGNTMPDKDGTTPLTIDYEKLGTAMATALIKAQKEVNTEAAMQLSDNEQLCELKTMIVNLSAELTALKADLVTANEATNNKLTLALQSTIESPNGTTVGDSNNPEVLEIG